MPGGCAQDGDGEGGARSSGFALAIAAELKEHGCANVVCPGTDPDLTGPDYEAQIADLYRRGLRDAARMKESPTLSCAPRLR